MKQGLTKILSNSAVQDYFHLVFKWDKSLPVPQPGQFLNLRVADSTVPLLRRPFAFSGYDANKGICSIIYQIKGRGTQILSSKKSDDTLDFTGPLGNTFLPFSSNHHNILMAGGVGLGPVLFFAEVLINRNLPFEFIFGARTKQLIPLSLLKIIPNLTLCTDDGTEGFKGTAVDFLKETDKDRLKRSTVFACGPYAMMKAAYQVCRKNGSPCYVSMEQIMACGMGACMGCVVEKKGRDGKYLRVCAEGPVFEAGEIEWT
ncbi:MAG: dihydroorotate dehydrogenase electron transfer subunit [Spirochaetales bacterium]|nr:dihydroorotate dehydrogenase electron transfer subunit [Spirochaetales bacterium]